MEKAHQSKLVDQYSDKSGAALVKIASRMKDQRAAKLAIDTLYSMERPLKKEASFPCGTRKDTFLSRIYFEGQREKIAAQDAEEIDKRLSLYETLHNVPNCARFKSGQEKTARESPSIPLLPLCKIASKAELIQAGEDFSRDYEKLASRDRRVFARNFMKTAKALHAPVPDAVKLYACRSVEANPALADNILLRKAAMEWRMGNDAGFGKLYERISSLNAADLPFPELRKLASALDAADEHFQIREHKLGKTIPDAWHSVFQVKQAEEDAEDANIEGMSRAEIISRFGEGVLEDVEDEEGRIDRERLKVLITALGGGKTEGAKSDGA